ncbi:MAG: hypothetical protein HQL07_00625 [Nitrospirae bacterium]|nr:hypothetical protein [Magnetococcales bacterium]
MTYNFDVTSNPEDQDNVIVNFKLSFGAACQVIATITKQIWSAAVSDLVPHEHPGNLTPPVPVTFNLIGKLNNSDLIKPDCTDMLVNFRTSNSIHFSPLKSRK